MHIVHVEIVILLTNRCFGVLVKYRFFLHLQNLAQTRLLRQELSNCLKKEPYHMELAVEREALVRQNERDV